MLPERIDALVGSMLGKDYRVLQPIGAGGMAIVYLVEHQTLLKRFAAKVLSIELASSAEARARFTQEAHAASQLDHENIVSISDFGITADQRPFFVMELLRGQTLDQRLGDGPMAIEEVVAVSVPVARALAHAHAEGIVHRDVKPENIFLVQRSQGRWGVKVVDFGIAKTTPVLPKLNRTKPIVDETFGSPLFMAPEMIRGEDESVDARSDVYSFGVVLYLMLCGRLPFYDENLLKVMQMHLSLPVPPPRDANPALSPELAAVVERALAKRREDRYPSMDALLLDLEAVLPPGSDRLLIEAQSGTALGETPFAATLAVQRQDSQRLPKITPSAMFAGQSALRTMRVSPLKAPTEPVLRTMRGSPRRSPSDEIRAVQLRSLTPRRLAIVVSSALVTGLLGAIAWTQLAERHGAQAGAVAPGHDELVIPDPAPAALAAPAVPSPRPPPPAAARTAAAPPDRGSEPAAAPEPHAAAPEPRAAAPEPASAPAGPHPADVAPPRAEHPVIAIKRPPLRPKPPLRPPLRPGKRVALATSPSGGPARGGAGAAAPASDGDPAPAGSSGPANAAEREPGTAPELQPTAPPPVARPSPPAGPGSLDATPEVATLDVRGSLSPSVVRRGVERQLSALRSCYQAAARAGQQTPAIDLQVSFEIDENSMATHVNAGGGFGSLARCAANALGQLHTQEAPDVGTAQVSVMIRFRPS
jgi:serine/threonine-protein kinase